jgi:hypothetical protein
VKRQSIEWEKIFARCLSDRGLTSTIHKEFKKLNTKRTNNPTKKLANELNTSKQLKSIKTPTSRSHHEAT